MLIIVHKSKTPQIEERVARALQTLLRDPSRPLDVRELARAAGLSTTQFRRLFSQETGTTPARLLQSVRMERAHKLIVETNRDIKEILFAAGFSDLSHFLRAFRQRYVSSPTELRHATNRGVAQFRQASTLLDRVGPLGHGR